MTRAHPMILLWAAALAALVVAVNAWALAWQAGSRLDRQGEAIAAIQIRLAGYE